MDGVRYQTPDHLAVICHKCTREERVRGITEERSTKLAHALGWRETSYGMVCRSCPGGGHLDLTLALAILDAPEEEPAC